VRSLTRPWLVLAIAIAVVALPTAASGALTAPAANSQTFQDSVGENPAAPDITTVTVSNDDAATITFKINIPNRVQYSPDIGVVMFLDSDANQATGDAENFGADFVIQLIQGEILLFKWDGSSDYTLSATQSSLNQTWSSGPTIRINASDLNNTRRLAFDVLALSGIVFDPATGPDLTNAHGDIAPTIGLYPYQLQLTKPTLVVKSLKPTPARPIAGRSFTLRLVAARSDTGALVQNGRATCLGRLGNARLKAQVQRVQGGAATCTWNLPATAKGKTFRGSVSVAFEGLKASQSYTGKVR
jgi:hypothetical protein